MEVSPIPVESVRAPFRKRYGTPPNAEPYPDPGPPDAPPRDGAAAGEHVRKRYGTPPNAEPYPDPGPPDAPPRDGAVAAEAIVHDPIRAKTPPREPWDEMNSLRGGTGVVDRAWGSQLPTPPKTPPNVPRGDSRS